MVVLSRVSVIVSKSSGSGVVVGSGCGVDGGENSFEYLCVLWLCWLCMIMKLTSLVDLQLRVVVPRIYHTCYLFIVLYPGPVHGTPFVPFPLVPSLPRSKASDDLPSKLLHNRI